MTPMEAWRVISANVMELYKRRKTSYYNGYTDADIEAEIICFNALKKASEANVPDTNVGNKSEWISVDERLPEEKGVYLTFQGGIFWINNFDAQKCKFGVWWHYTPDGRYEKNYRFIEADKITHWMPLPEPPKGE